MAEPAENYLILVRRLLKQKYSFILIFKTYNLVGQNWLFQYENHNFA